MSRSAILLCTAVLLHELQYECKMLPSSKQRVHKGSQSTSPPRSKTLVPGSRPVVRLVALLLHRSSTGVELLYHLELRFSYVHTCIHTGIPVHRCIGSDSTSLFTAVVYSRTTIALLLSWRILIAIV